MGTQNQYMQPFFDSLSQGVQVAQHLASAAQQQRQFDAQNAIEQSKQALAEQENQDRQQSVLGDALMKGAQPVTNGKLPATPTVSAAPLSAPTALPSPASDQPVATPGSAFGGGAPLATPAPSIPQNMASSPGLQTKMTAQAADPAQTIRLGGRQVQMPSVQDQLDRATALDEAKSSAGREPIGATLEKAGGFAPGTSMRPEAMGRIAGIIKQLKPDGDGKVIQTSHISKDDKGNQTLITQYTDGSFDEKPLKAKGSSDKFGNPGEGGTPGEKQMTPNERQNAGDKAMANFHKFESDEMDLRQQLDRLDHAIATKGAYTVATDDKGKSKLVKTPSDKAGVMPDAPTILSDLQAQRENVGNRLRQVLTNKYDAGDQYAKITTGKQTTWGMSRDQALSDVDAKVNGTKAPPAPPAGAPAQATPTKAAAPAAATPAKHKEVLTNAAGDTATLTRVAGKLQWQITKKK